ncbi:helix-turn-helix transcriptional regulator [Mycetocola sp. 2940]|uniref:helix-turn-helix transcriptional regulator n=1 Tax=Mycetocola sp. 2940 TaxID=3156452 RepID=UPI003393803B
MQSSIPTPVTSRSEQSALSNRSFDQLEIAHLGSGHSLTVRPTFENTARWPLLALYALRGPASAVRPSGVTELKDAEFTVIRNVAPLEIHTGDSAELLVIRIPAGTLGPHASSMDSADGQIWSTAEGTASLVGHLLNGVAAQRPDYFPANPAQLAQHIVGLMALLCVDGRQAPDAHGRGRMLQLAKDYIESHLGDLDLTPDRIASHENVSTRTLHRLFESEGLTVRGWTRSRRLEHCRVDLADTSSAAIPVSAIGSRWGLWDAAHFSRLFKAAYGLSPRAYRSAVHTSGGAAGYVLPLSIDRHIA